MPASSSCTSLWWILICLGMSKLPVGWHVDRYSYSCKCLIVLKALYRQPWKPSERCLTRGVALGQVGSFKINYDGERFQQNKRRGKKVVLKKEWSLTRVVSHEGSLSPGQSLTRAVLPETRQSLTISHHGSFSLGWSFTRMVFQFHQGDFSPQQSLTRAVSHKGSLSPGQSLTRLVFHQGGLSPGQSFTRVVSHQGVHFVTIT